MKTETTVTSRTQTETQWCLAEDKDVPETEQRFLALSYLSESRIREIAFDFDVQPEFLHELNGVFADFREAVHADLADIWARLDRIEELQRHA